MLRSITSEVKASDLAERALVFSNCEVERKSRKTGDRYAHCRAMFNLNKQLMIETSNEATST
jgi:hypothetical protein